MGEDLKATQNSSNTVPKKTEKTSDTATPRGVRNAARATWSQIAKFKPILRKHVLKISLLALLVSFANFGFTSYYNLIQYRRWRIANAPRLRVSVKLLPIRELNEEELIRMNENNEWYSDYRPLVHPKREDGLFSGKYSVKSELIFWDETRSMPLRVTTKGMQTSSDVNFERERLNLTSISLFKRYQFQLGIANEGQGQAYDIELRRKLSAEPTSLFLYDDATPGPLSLRGNDTKHWHEVIDVRRDSLIPESFTFEISLKYSFEGVQYQSETKHTYYSLENRWQFP